MLRILVTLFFLFATTEASLHAQELNNDQITAKITELSQGPLGHVEPFYGNILVLKAGKEIVNLSLGKAVEEFNINNTEHTRFLLASVSKQFTAAAIHRLINEGKLSLSDSIEKYFPKNMVLEKYQDLWGKITIEDLLSHQAGLLKDPQHYQVNVYEKQNLANLVMNLLKETQLLPYERGAFHYSNIGFTLLARIVEIVSKFDFESYLQYKVFQSIGMKDSGVFHRSKIIPQMANGYYRDEDDKLSKMCCQDFSVHAGSHNLFASTKDLINWIEEMTTHNNVISKDFLTDRPYFNGLFYEDHDGLGRHYWHDGFASGFASRLSFFPDEKISIIILMNRVNVFTYHRLIEGIHKHIAEYFLIEKSGNE